MQFIVKLRDGEPSDINQYPHAVLIADNWDDYGYKSTFRVKLYVSPEVRVDLGEVKIIEADHGGGYTKLPEGVFEKLSDNFGSLGSDIDYYHRLIKLGPLVYRLYLTGLRDVAYSDHAKAAVEDSESYRVSLLRFSNADRTLEEATRLLKGMALRVRRRPGSGFAMKFKSRADRGSKAFTVEFDFVRREGLPNRINALIGYNGTGKTRLLSNLAIVCSGYGYRTKEDHLRSSAGRFVGGAPDIKTVVVVSYSAFDTFVIPGKTSIERRRLAAEGELFGYVYCGLRELSGEDGPDSEQAYRLRTPNEIEGAYLSALRRVRKAKRTGKLIELLRPLLADPSFQRIGLSQLFAEDDDDEIGRLFRSLSSGHKAVLQIITELTAHISGVQPTLVLIDEPETHLHPPLLAAFLKSVRACLETFNGYAIIATHSPVVLQETPARYVRVLRRVGDESHITGPSVETFGESIGVITQEVFNLGDLSTDWHDTLRSLAQTHTPDAIEKMFGRKLGFAARSYLLSVRDELEA